MNCNAVAECHAYYIKAIRMGEHYVVTRLLSGSRSSLVVKQAIFLNRPDIQRLEKARDEIGEIEGCLFHVEFHLAAVSRRHNMEVITIPLETRKVLGLEVLPP